MNVVVERSAADPCPERMGDRPCAPLNKVFIKSRNTLVPVAYAACTCGRRFALQDKDRRDLGRLSSRLFLGQGSHLYGSELDECIRLHTWPIDRRVALSKPGVVPVGTSVLHSPAARIGEVRPSVRTFEGHLLAVMKQSNGAGLAANQVGVPIRMLAHNFPKVAPPVLLNAEKVKSAGMWRFEEGCLSLQLPGVRATVERPRRITVRGCTTDGGVVVIMAGELVARVLQHELDHLDGVEYVQRLKGVERERVYELMESAGIDVGLMPPCHTA